METITFLDVMLDIIILAALSFISYLIIRSEFSTAEVCIEIPAVDPAPADILPDKKQKGTISDWLNEFFT
jgi:hypothetical protein